MCLLINLISMVSFSQSSSFRNATVSERLNKVEANIKDKLASKIVSLNKEKKEKPLCIVTVS